jgi:hypothetical protein
MANRESPSTSSCQAPSLDHQLVIEGRNLFRYFAAFLNPPGWMWGKHDHHADHEWLADLLPLSSTFTGHLDGAEALYDGSNHNLIGVRNFLSGTPQLAVLLGMTRAGKSAFMCDQQMMLVAPFPEHNRDEINHIATLLAPWNEQRLVCGHSTLSLTGKIAHFDLTYIPESNRQLKELAGFLIANYGRQHIITLPRGKRKRVIFEEVARTLDIPGGEQLVSEFYAQLSKFSTWIISIVQQYSRFQQSGIRPIVFGNAKQFFFTRMNDRRDVDDVTRDRASTCRRRFRSCSSRLTFRRGRTFRPPPHSRVWHRSGIPTTR